MLGTKKSLVAVAKVYLLLLMASSLMQEDITAETSCRQTKLSAKLP